MPTKHLFAGLLLGSLATVAIGLGFWPQPAPELPTAWHDFAEVPRDSHEFDRQWHDLGTAVWQETIKHPRATLFVACQLKTSSVRASDAAASGR